MSTELASEAMIPGAEATVWRAGVVASVDSPIAPPEEPTRPPSLEEIASANGCVEKYWQAVRVMTSARAERYMTTILHRMGVPSDLRSDFMQETTLRVISSAANPNGPWLEEDNLGWAGRVLERNVIDVWRHETGSGKYGVESVGDRGTYESYLGETYGGLDVVPLRVALRGAMGLLSSTYREVVTRYYVHDQSVSDISAAMGVPDGTVKSHLFHARRAMREVLEAQGTME